MRDGFISRSRCQYYDTYAYVPAKENQHATLPAAGSQLSRLPCNMWICYYIIDWSLTVFFTLRPSFKRIFDNRDNFLTVLTEFPTCRYSKRTVLPPLKLINTSGLGHSHGIFILRTYSEGKCATNPHGHGHGHGIFILATHPEGTWTANPKPSFTQYPSADPTKGILTLFRPAFQRRPWEDKKLLDDLYTFFFSRSSFYSTTPLRTN
jgi:hypothetical protein